MLCSGFGNTWVEVANLRQHVSFLVLIALDMSSSYLIACIYLPVGLREAQAAGIKFTHRQTRCTDSRETWRG